MPPFNIVFRIKKSVFENLSLVLLKKKKGKKISVASNPKTMAEDWNLE